MRTKRPDKLTHSALRWVILDELERLVDDTKFEELLLANRPASDDVMLGAILVHRGDGKPRDDFLLAAMGLGFDESADVPQHQLYEHFR